MPQPDEGELMCVFTTAGVRDLEVYDEAERADVGSHWNAVRRYLGTGDTSDISEFSGASVAGIRLETDPDVIDDVEAAGDLDIEHIYVQRR